MAAYLISNDFNHVKRMLFILSKGQSRNFFIGSRIQKMPSCLKCTVMTEKNAESFLKICKKQVKLTAFI